MGVCACFRNEGHLYLSAPTNSAFLSLLQFHRCVSFLKIKVVLLLSVSFIDNTGRRQNCVKLSVRGTVVLRWSVIHSLSMPDL